MRLPCMFALALVAGGCGGSPVAPAVCATPATIEVTVESGPLLNPDAAGRALPTEVRLYRLRDASLFETAAFDSVWLNGEEVLGDALLGMDSLTLYPGESAGGSIAPESDARALVAMAVVRQPAGHTWRTIIEVSELPCGARSRVRLRLDEYRIERAPARSGEE